MTKRLVNLSEKVDIELDLNNLGAATATLKDLNAPLLGAVQIRTLVSNQVPELNGYMVVDSDESMLTGSGVIDQEKETQETTETVKNENVDDQLTAMLAAESNESGSEIAGTDQPEPVKETATKTIAEDVKQQVQEGNVAKAAKPRGTTKPRKDRSELTKALYALDYAGKDANGVTVTESLHKALETAGYNTISIDSKVRWYGVVHKDQPQNAKAQRIDVSPRKNGDFGLTLYNDGKSLGVRTVITKDSDVVAKTLEWINSDVVKAAFVA